MKTMAHGSLFHHISSLFHHTSFRSTILQSFTFRSINQKYQKIFTLPFIYLYQITLLQVTVKGFTTPLSSWVQVVDCLCRYSVTCALSPTGLITWYKLREILTLLCCITLSSSRENQRSAQEVAWIYEQDYL